jgi:hypothetical protein
MGILLDSSYDDPSYMCVFKFGEPLLFSSKVSYIREKITNIRIMLLEFSLENYRSVADLQTLSFVAAKIKSKNKELEEKNLIHVDKDMSLLRSIGIYGANGSGKSNVVQGFISMMVVIHDSMKDEQTISKQIEPFELNPEKQKQPSYFQIQFIIEGKKFRYGFEATKDKIVSEWLFGPAEKNETMYFSRTGQEIQRNKTYFKEGRDLEAKTTTNNLFLNVVNAFNGPVAQSIKGYLKWNVAGVAGFDEDLFRTDTIDILVKEGGTNDILRLLNMADVGIDTLLIENDQQEKASETPKVTSSRKVYSSAGELVGMHDFDFDEYESGGTIKMFNLAGALLRTLQRGSLFVIDELDAQFHPLLSRKIVEMFNNPELNKNGAQLLFVTHDTNLLDKDLLRRDQIYFTEKDSKGRTCLYSLYDFKGVRNDAAFEKNYIQGKYGAIPYLGDFNTLFDVK